MNYSELLLGKKIYELEYEDIHIFFEKQQEESNSLEFKSFSVEYGNVNKSIEGAIRSICGFLNSDGGILILGAPEGKEIEGKKEKVFTGDLTPFPTLIEKDRLISKISDSITPLPIGIRVQIIENDKYFLYIFEIDKSNYSPHQFQNTYLARLDGQTKPAPHYLVDALFKKIRYPNLEAFIKLEKISHDGSNYFLDISIIIFNFSELQNEENLSFSLTCQEGVFADSTDPSYIHFYKLGGHQRVSKRSFSILHFGSPIREGERIIINSTSVQQQFDNKVTLYLHFGGKKSPLKVSNYELDFSKINWADSDNPNYLFSEINENKSISDEREKEGVKKSETIKDMLGR